MLVGSLSHEDRASFMKSPLPTLDCLMTFPFHAAWQAVRLFFSAYSAPLWNFRVLFWSLLFVCIPWLGLDTFTFLREVNKEPHRPACLESPSRLSPAFCLNICSSIPCTLRGWSLDHFQLFPWFSASQTCQVETVKM